MKHVSTAYHAWDMASAGKQSCRYVDWKREGPGVLQAKHQNMVVLNQALLQGTVIKWVLFQNIF